MFGATGLIAPAAYFGLSDQGFGEILAFCVPSVGAIGLWILIAEYNQAQATAAAAVLRAIERTWGVHDGLRPRLLADGTRRRDLAIRFGGPARHAI